tara:strand:+ start:1017 stop:1598 length:582 start_codon:yes stop_codon:yes gene_type:complete
MARLSSALQTAVEKKVIQCYESVFVDVDGGVRITNAPMSVDIVDPPGGSSQQFISVGQFLGFSQIQEERLFTTNEVTITLAGLPAFDNSGKSFVEQFLNHDYVDKSVRIYRTFFDHDTLLDSFLIFEGRISAPVIEDDPQNTTTVAATCSSHWIDYERTNGTITNDNRQQSLHTGDRAFQFANQVIKDIQWKE